MVRIFVSSALVPLLVNHVFAQETTPNFPSVSPVIHPSLCKGQNTGKMIADSTCTSCFYECDNGLANRFHCPSHLIFSEGLQCSIADPSIPVALPCLGTSKFDCCGNPDGFYPDPSSRTIFHSCKFACGSDFTCPKSTYFDSSPSVCVYDDNAHSLNLSSTR